MNALSRVAANEISIDHVALAINAISTGKVQNPPLT
jgi:hypothetical protein